jgi:hypothetical protein
MTAANGLPTYQVGRRFHRAIRGGGRQLIRSDDFQRQAEPCPEGAATVRLSSIREE